MEIRFQIKKKSIKGSTGRPKIFQTILWKEMDYIYLYELKFKSFIFKNK